MKKPGRGEEVYLLGSCITPDNAVSPVFVEVWFRRRRILSDQFLFAFYDEEGNIIELQKIKAFPNLRLSEAREIAATKVRALKMKWR